MAMRQTFATFRVAFWVFSAGIICLYLYGLFFQAYTPLQLGLLSFVCIGLLVLFVFHEVPPAEGAAQASPRGRPHQQGAPRVLTI